MACIFSAWVWSDAITPHDLTEKFKNALVGIECDVGVTTSLENRLQSSVVVFFLYCTHRIPERHRCCTLHRPNLREFVTCTSEISPNPSLFRRKERWSNTVPKVWRTLLGVSCFALSDKSYLPKLAFNFEKYRAPARLPNVMSLWVEGCSRVEQTNLTSLDLRILGLFHCSLASQPSGFSARDITPFLSILCNPVLFLNEVAAGLVVAP
jgi:hypothetical protein